jgi:hypothetical protein
MNNIVFFALSICIGFTGVFIPGLIFQDIINPRFMILSLLAVAAILYLGVSTIKNMPAKIHIT